MDMTPQTVYGQRPDDYPPDYDPSLNGIGGWLILVIIGRFLGFIDIFNLPKLVSFYGRLASFDAYITLTICFALIVEVGLSIAILVFLFSRKIVFRTLFVIQCSLGIIFLFCTALYSSSLGVDSTWSHVVSAIIGGVIWIPYMFVSKRVKNTFIYPNLYPAYEYMYGYENNYPSYPSSADTAADIPKEADTSPKVSAGPTPDGGAYYIKYIQIPDSDQVECPACNTVQRNDRSCCYKCGARFIQ